MYTCLSLWKEERGNAGYINLIYVRFYEGAIDDFLKRAVLN